MEFSKKLVRLGELGIAGLVLTYPVHGCAAPSEYDYRVSPYDEGRVQIESRYPGYFPPTLRIGTTTKGLEAVNKLCPVKEVVHGGRTGQLIVRLKGGQDEVLDCLSHFTQETQQ
jgi:hypothetical protein